MPSSGQLLSNTSRKTTPIPSKIQSSAPVPTLPRYSYCTIMHDSTGHNSSHVTLTSREVLTICSSLEDHPSPIAHPMPYCTPYALSHTLCPIAYCDDIKGVTHMLFVSCNWFKPKDHVGDLPHLVLWLLSHSHLLPAHSQHCKGGCVAAQQILHTT